MIYVSQHLPTLFYFIRCVPDNHRSYSLGFQFIFQRSLGFVPGPIIFGWMFDSGCLFWGESCNRRGRCQIYNMWSIATKITIFGFVVKGKIPEVKDSQMSPLSDEISNPQNITILRLRSFRVVSILTITLTSVVGR